MKNCVNLIVIFIFGLVTVACIDLEARNRRKESSSKSQTSTSTTTTTQAAPTPAPAPLPALPAPAPSPMPVSPPVMTDIPVALQIPTMASLSAEQSFSSMPGYVQLLGASQSLTSVSEVNGVRASTLIQGPLNIGASTLRFGKITDPLNSSRKVLYSAIINSDPLTFYHTRVEVGPSAAPMEKTGVTYWIAAEIYVPASRYASGAGNILQIHNSTPTSDVFGPFALVFTPAGYALPRAGISVISASSTQSDPALPGFNQKTTYHWNTDNPGFMGSTMGNYPVNTWVKWVFKYRGDPAGKTGFLQAWMNGVQVVNANGISIGTAPQGYPTDYVKVGVDDYQSAGGSAGIWQLLRSVHVVKDNGYTLTQVMDLLK